MRTYSLRYPHIIRFSGLRQTRKPPQLLVYEGMLNKAFREFGKRAYLWYGCFVID